MTRQSGHDLPIWPCPSTRTPAPGVMKFTIFKEILVHQLYNFYPPYYDPWKGVMKFTICSIPPYRCYTTTFGKDWPNS